MPSGFRAEAAVAVHHNAESFFEDVTSFDALGYIDRETAVLEALSYSDIVWQEVDRRLAIEGWIRGPEDSQRILRSVSLPHPKDGEWRFLATTRDPALSARVVDVWAEAFVAAANEGVALAVQQEAIAARIGALAVSAVEREATCMRLGSSHQESINLQHDLEALPAGDVARVSDTVRLARLAAQVDGVLEIASATAPMTVTDQLELARAITRALQAEAEACATGAQALQASLSRETSVAAELASLQLGLSAQLEVALLRNATVPDAPVARDVWFIGIGALLGLLAWLLLASWRGHLVRDGSVG
jgi:hypothetical protein